METEVNRLETQGLRVIIKYVCSPCPGGIIVEQSISSGTIVSSAEHVLILKVANE